MGGITTVGLSVCAAALAGSYGTNNHWIAVGTSGIAYASGNTALGSEFDRNQVNINDLSVNEKITMISNWSPNDISGCIMKEFGVFTSIGSQMLNREVMAGSIIFDGESELQIQQTIIFKV